MNDGGDLSRFLARAVLDVEFRELVRRAPDEAFAGYTLSDADKAAIRAGDAGMLRLLGAAHVGESAAGTERDPGAAPSFDEPAPAGPPVVSPPIALQPIALRVTVQPWAQQTPEGLKLSFTSAIEHAAAPAAESTPAPPPSTPRSWSAWDHDTDSQTTRAAADAVQAAAPAERRDAILELMRALSSGEQIGGDGV